MKTYILEFLRRGLISCGFGPLVLAVIYLVLQHCEMIRVLSIDQVCLGIFSLSALAFVAGGMNIVYQIERLPLMAAVLIHGAVLYICYLFTYLINGWMQWGSYPILAFTVIFVVGYLVIWAIIYATTKKNTDKVNRVLNRKQQ